MKPAIKHYLLVAGLATLAACNNNGNGQANSTDTTISGHLKQAAQNLGAATDQAADKLKDAASTTASDIKARLNANPDSAFIVRASRSNDKELQMIQAGLNNGTSASLKSVARKMQADHQQLKKDLNELAASKGYPVTADADAGKAIDELGNDKGNNWDKAWVAHMINDHKQDISDYEAAKDKVKSQQLRVSIINTLPVLRSHLEMLQNLQDRM